MRASRTLFIFLFFIILYYTCLNSCAYNFDKFIKDKSHLNIYNFKSL